MYVCVTCVLYIPYFAEVLCQPVQLQLQQIPETLCSLHGRITLHFRAVYN